MYRLSRALLMLGVLAGLYFVVIIMIYGWPASGILVGLFVVAAFTRKGYRHLNTLGSARWASEKELRRAGMLDANSGLIIGRLAVDRQRSLPGAIWKLFSWRLNASHACAGFLEAFFGRPQPVVRLSHAIHSLVVSPSGGGKGVSGVLPFLLNCPESCVVIDLKGENARLTSEHRQKEFGHECILLDPYMVYAQTPHGLNPIDFIDKDSPVAIDECNTLSNALVVRNSEERERHWNDSAEAWISALLATVVRYGEREKNTRSLQTVRDILSDPKRLDMTLALMRQSDAWGGLLARMGGQLAHYVDKEKSSVMTTVARHLRFLDTVAIAESTKTSTFDPTMLRAGKMTVYLILPPDHMRAQSALLRMWIGSLLRVVVRGGLQERNKVHYLLDEGASLGHMESIDDAVDKYRGYGVRLQFYFQSLGQLKECFQNGQEQTLLSNTSQVFFGVNDNATAEYVSARLGEQTIIVDSGGASTGYSDQDTSGAHPTRSRGRSANRSSNWQQQVRKLLKPEEIMALSPREAITFTPGVRPIFTTLLRYYEEGNFARQLGWFRRLARACGTFLVAAFLCLLCVTGAVLLTAGIRRGVTPRRMVPQVLQGRYMPPIHGNR